MLLFEEELSLTVEEKPKLITVSYWFIPEKRFLCEKGVLMFRELTEKEFAATTAHFSRTRIKPVEVEFDGDNIIVRGTKGTRVFSWAQIEEKERLRKKALETAEKFPVKTEAWR